MNENRNDDKLAKFLRENAPEVPERPKDEFQQIIAKIESKENFSLIHHLKNLYSILKWPVPIFASLLLVIYLYIGNGEKIYYTDINGFSDQELSEIVDYDLYTNGVDDIGSEWLELADSV